MQADLDLGAGMRVRTLVPADASLLTEATATETAPALWGPEPVGPYSAEDARAALAAWDPDAGGQFSVGVLRGDRLLAALGLMPGTPGTLELAYWTRPEERGRGIASRAVQATTSWAHDRLEVARIWLEIRPANEASIRLARRTGYSLERLAPQHCRDWAVADPALDSWHDCLIWAHERRPR
jgi:RimJ/RimL family protein N-acetyltransferase